MIEREYKRDYLCNELESMANNQCRKTYKLSIPSSKWYVIFEVYRNEYKNWWKSNLKISVWGEITCGKNRAVVMKETIEKGISYLKDLEKRTEEQND